MASFHRWAQSRQTCGAQDVYGCVAYAVWNKCDNDHRDQQQADRLASMKSDGADRGQPNQQNVGYVANCIAGPHAEAANLVLRINASGIDSRRNAWSLPSGSFAGRRSARGHSIINKPTEMKAAPTTQTSH